MSMTTPQSGSVAFANNVLNQHPLMAQRNPDLAAAAVATNDQTSADALAATSHVSGIQQSVQDHQTNYNSRSLWGTVVGDAQGAMGWAVKGVQNLPGTTKIMEWSAKPVQELQKDFKFVTSIYRDHGVAVGLLATLGIIAGGVAGSIFAPGEGTVIGLDLAAAAERHFLGTLIPSFKESYNKSNDPNYIANPGSIVANAMSNIPGFASLKDTKHGWGQTISGATDIAFDFTADPLIILGKLQGTLKRGGLLRQDVAKDVNGVPVLNAEGKPTFLFHDNGQPVVVPAMKWAQQSDSVTNFLKSVSGVQMSADGLHLAYQAGKMAQDSLGARIASTLNPLAPSQLAFARAVDKIVDIKNGFEIQHLFPSSQFTRLEADTLAAAETPTEVINAMGSSLFSKEIDAAGDAIAARHVLVLPTLTAGRSFVGNWAEKNRQIVGDTSFNEERNILLPKKVAVYGDIPIKDKAGVVKLDKDGQVKTKYGLLTNPDGSNKVARLGGGFYSFDANGNWAMRNAIQGKIRTFTGYKSLTINDKKLEQSGKQIDFSSQDAGVQILNELRYSMPYKAAVEHTAKIMGAPDEAKRASYYAAAVMNTIKSMGIEGKVGDEFYNKVMSQAQRSATSGDQGSGMYFADHFGNPGGTVEMKPLYDENGTIIKERDPVRVAIGNFQHGANGIIDYKTLRVITHQVNAYNRMYMKSDDWATYYTEKVFAPLTLFTTGFGIRVAGNEAMHQIIRSGLGTYLEHVVIANGLRYGKKSELIQAQLADRASKLAQALTEEDHAAALTGEPVASNYATKFIDNLEKRYASLEKLTKVDGLKQVAGDVKNSIRPFGYVSSKILPYMAEDKINAIARMHDLYSGQSLPSLTASSHTARGQHATDEEVDQFIQSHGHTKSPSENIMGLFEGGDPNFNNFWALNASKFRRDESLRDIAKDYITMSKTKGFNKLTNDEQWNKVFDSHEKRIANPNMYESIRPYSVGMREGVPASFASNQVNAMRGLVEGSDGTIHTNILENIANNKPTSVDDIRKIPLESRPLKVMGKINRPTMSNVLERVTTVGYRSLINPIIDYISREPLFNHFYYENYRSFAPMIQDGRLTEDEAIRISVLNGAKQMVPLIHNPALRSQFATMNRALLPFYFAQEQAMKRVGRLINTNPQAIRDFQMIQQGMNNPGFVHTDANGTKYIVYPLLGEFGNSVSRALNALGFSQYTGLPSSVTGSTASLLSVLPEMKLPGVGPLANVALSDLANMFPTITALDKVANVATGANPFDPRSTGFTKSNFIDAMIPSSPMRAAWNALAMDDRESTVHNAILSAMAAAYYHGDLPEHYAQLPAWKQSEILDRIHNNARTNILVKGILSFFVPLSPGVSNDYYNKELQSFRSEFVTMTLPKTQGGLGLSLPEATNKFLAEHGTSSISYTVARTTSGSGGAILPLADSTMQFLDANKDIINSHPMGAAYLVPQTASSADALKVEQHLLAMHLRSQQTPQGFMQAIYVAKGWADMAASQKDFEAQLTKDKASGDKHAIGVDMQIWNDVTLKYGQSNPIWYSDYKNTLKSDSANTALKDLQFLNANGKIDNSLQSQGIKKLLASYDYYHAMLAESTVNGKHLPQYAQLKSEWYDYLMRTIATNTELTNVINGVFKRVV